MVSIKETIFYDDVIKELNYPFGDVFIFEGIVVSEIGEGVIFSWSKYGKLISEDIAMYLGTTGKELIYISNRINSYSVLATDWLKYYKNNYCLKSYYVVSSHRSGDLNYIIENLFFKDKIKRFTDLYVAMNWVKNGLLETG
ncbi:hypothetical protein [Mariniflexile sp. AS56]|uniref:hypothetical protein n=1 Tax=Mariniflexile sp. AS56 TaxID=3063957 RepID=UPI0026F160EC|nr:hypothetical protein [Mariniflexile sp. AS56]MDO7172693.1 hypothetical protein [Mariniflexile sp. AS56]